MDNFKKWAIEGLKSALRYAVIYAVPIAIDAGIAGVSTLVVGVPTLHLDPAKEWAIRGFLAFADKALHEWKKDTDKEGSWKGLIGF